jgi:hypothetical protein
LWVQRVLCFPQFAPGGKLAAILPSDNWSATGSSWGEYEISLGARQFLTNRIGRKKQARRRDKRACPRG